MNRRLSNWATIAICVLWIGLGIYLFGFLAGLYYLGGEVAVVYAVHKLDPGKVS